jgi:hypothetical protein
MNATTSKTPKDSMTSGWTRHLGSVLATTLIFVSGTSILSLLEAFH